MTSNTRVSTSATQTGRLPELYAELAKASLLEKTSTAPKPVSVLIVEDDAQQREILCNLFEAANEWHVSSGSPITFEWTTANNALEAMQILSQRNDFQLVSVKGETRSTPCLGNCIELDICLSA